MVRLLNDEGARGYGYYRQQIDFTTRSPFARNYGDYFAGRIVFPIRNMKGEVIGIIGRRPDNRGSVHWLKQKAGEGAITTKSWLYGIDKAYRSHQALQDGDPGGRHLRLFRLLSLAAGPGPAGGCIHVGVLSFRRGDGHFQTAWCGALYRCL